MTPTTAPARPHQSYRHEAFFYDGDEEFIAGLVPFVRDGLAAEQPVMVALPDYHLEIIAAALGSDAADVQLVDMTEMGHNPARIIPGWHRFLERSCRDVQPVRGVGEPIWAARRPAELIECQFHEALLNVAVDPDTPLWLRCPYDRGTLDEATLAEAHRSHPIVVEALAYSGSTSYTGSHRVREFFVGDLPLPAGPTEQLEFGADGLAAVRGRVIEHATAGGLDPERVWEVALAVHEVAANSVRHGGGHGVLRVWHSADAVVCEVTDSGAIDDPLAGRRRPGANEPDGRGLWLANQLCDLVQVRSTELGAVVRIVSWR